MYCFRTVFIILALTFSPIVLAAKDHASFRETVKQVLPAVVSLEPQNKAPASNSRQDIWPSDLLPWIPFPGTDTLRFDTSKPVRLGTGSGFIVDPQGVVVTNYHVVKGASQVEVRLKDGRTFTTSDIKGDPKTDIAILRFSVKDSLPSLQWGDSKEVEIGDQVLAVGAPFGLTGSVTHGIISGKGRSLHLHTYEDFLQTDAAINPGNSGGPLVTLDGKVIGVNSVIKSRSGGFQGVGLAVSSQLAKQVVDNLVKDGAVSRAYIGIKVGDLDRAVADRMGLAQKGGAVVAEVLPDTPAAKAGLKDGDVVTAVAGKPIATASEIMWAISGLPVGKPVEVAIFREGKSQTVSVTPAKQSEDFGTAVEPREPVPTSEKGMVRLEKIGAWAADFSSEWAKRYDFKDRFDGAIVVRVDPQSWASVAGLRQGTVITKVDNRPVASAKDLAKAVEEASLTNGIQFQYRTAGAGTGYLMIRSGSAK